MFLVLLLNFHKWRHLCHAISTWQDYCISKWVKNCNGSLLCTVNTAVMTVPDDQKMSVCVLWMLSACALNMSLIRVSVTWRHGWEPAPFLLRPHLLLSVLINQKGVTVRFSHLFYLFCCIINLNTNTWTIVLCSLKYLMNVFELLMFCWSSYYRGVVSVVSVYNCIDIFMKYIQSASLEFSFICGIVLFSTHDHKLNQVHCRYWREYLGFKMLMTS